MISNQTEHDKELCKSNIEDAGRRFKSISEFHYPWFNLTDSNFVFVYTLKILNINLQLMVDLISVI